MLSAGLVQVAFHTKCKYYNQSKLTPTNPEDYRWVIIIPSRGAEPQDSWVSWGSLCAPPPQPHMGSRGKANQNQHPSNWNEIKHEGLKSNCNIMHMLLQQHHQWSINRTTKNGGYISLERSQTRSKFHYIRK